MYRSWGFALLVVLGVLLLLGVPVLVVFVSLGSSRLRYSPSPVVPSTSAALAYDEVRLYTWPPLVVLPIGRSSAAASAAHGD